MQQLTPGKVFFTSIPKCGKNIVLSFFDKLGLVSFSVETNDPARYTHAKHLETRIQEGQCDLPHFSLEIVRNALEALEPVMAAFVKQICSLPENVWVNHHFAFDPELHAVLREERIPIVFLYRDPRDCLLSMANFLLLKGEPTDFAAKLATPDLDAALTLFLAGEGTHLPFAVYFDSYQGWREADGVLALRFEDIIGPKGGGREESQIRCLSALADHVGWRGSAHQLASAIMQSFNPQAGTFYKGQVGGWKKSFSPAMRAVFDKDAGHLLQEWGYEESEPMQESSAPMTVAASCVLLEAMREEYQETVQRLTDTFQRVELDSRQRLAEIHKRDQAIAEMRDELRRQDEALVTAEREKKQLREEVRRMQTVTGICKHLLTRFSRPLSDGKKAPQEKFA
jgi:hypothetical protein